MPEYMTDKELSEYLKSRGLKISVFSLQRQRVTGGGIPYKKVGSRVRYHKPDVDKWLEGLPTISSTSETTT